MTFLRVHHVAILVRDLPAMRQMFVDKLGFQTERSFSNSNSQGEFLRLGDSLVELLTYPDAAYLQSRLAGAESKIDHIALEVGDFSEAVALLKHHGQSIAGSISQTQIGTSGRLSQEDTHGVSIQIIEPAR